MQPADRGLLLGVAYRLLGSAAEAEDAVQEAYARWYALTGERRDRISSPAAWLVTTVSRICLDVLGSARVRRERYVGEWLPEPVPAAAYRPRGARDDPADAAVLDESLSMALLVVLETMTPAERVAFILHDVFRYRFAEIAEIVGRTPQACRQLASAGRKKAGRRSGTRKAGTDPARVVAAFTNAWQTGDLTGLINLLDPDVRAVADGGGLVTAAPYPVHGAERVARFLVGIHQRQPDLQVAETVVNAQPGIVARDARGAVLAVISCTVADGRIDRIWAMRNPTKLTAWTPSAGTRVSGRSR